MFGACFFRQVKFQGAKTSGSKRVAEEVILEVEDLAASAEKQQKFDDSVTAVKPIVNQTAIGTFKKPQTSRNGFSQKSLMANLVKRKTPATATVTATTTTTEPAMPATATSENTTKTSSTRTETTSSTSTVAKPTTNALSLLSSYDNNTDSDDSDSD